MSPRNIGILGGTFNPIHNGHLHIVKSVSQYLEPDFVLFIPSNIPPHKAGKQILSATHRMEMVRLALLETPQFKPCDVEVKRSGPSYTVETVRTLKKRYPNDRLFFIVGMDAFSQLKTWKAPEEILALCDFVIISRPGFPFSMALTFPSVAPPDRIPLQALDTGDQLNYSVSLTSKTALHFMRIPPSQISASDIRKRISEGKSTRNLLPHFVESYIISHGMYKGDSDF